MRAVRLKDKSLYSKEDFLESDFCRRIYGEIDASIQIQSPLPQYESGIAAETSTKTRPKIVSDLESDTKGVLSEKLSQLMPEISEHFQIELTELRDIHFAIYEEGNYVARHVDALDSGKSINAEHFRKVTVVVFLNDETEEPSAWGYGGGQLTIYDIFEGEVFKDFGFPVSGLTGKLVAFPSKSHHEVTPVTHGRRLIVSTGFS